ncbi:T9SS type A sorting domain-containing protein [Crocinitomicaceae bacterium]|nr:T9SS type A sorting domain-containing protein [Crocinitomicaceae bacterium]
MKRIVIFLATCLSTGAFAQFDGAALTPGSLAIDKDSSAIIAWANYCEVERGWLDISNKALGLASYGTDDLGTGYVNGLDVVSLGDSGIATLSFNPSIADGPGPDFAIFENSFSHNFLELAFVEVSSNGVDFYRFPAISNFPDTSQIGPFDAISDPTRLHNLAGKYRSTFGTPFDLNELDTIQELNINQITHVRIVDVVGSVNPSFGSQDINGNYINDPFPTPFPSGGFDLDGVAVLHQGPLSNEELTSEGVSIYPNPVRSGSAIQIQSSAEITSIQIFNLMGSLIYQGNLAELKTIQLNEGAYLICVETNANIHRQKLKVTH